jgi:hypothetical protein
MESILRKCDNKTICELQKENEYIDASLWSNVEDLQKLKEDFCRKQEAGRTAYQ